MFTCVCAFVVDKKVEDEVPAVLKKLRYPFNIPKQYMFSIGASHAWPAMLGALDWMRELIVVSNRTPGAPAKLLVGPEQIRPKLFGSEMSCKCSTTICSLDGSTVFVFAEYE